MISFVLASILCVATPATTDERPASSASSVQVVSHSFELGTEVVQQARQNYVDGQYSEFLKKMDRDYLSAKKENGLEGLIEIRKESARAQIHPEFARSYRVIQETKNEQLLASVKGSEDSVFVQKVRSAASSTQAIDDSLSSLSAKVPGSGKNADENQLIDIDLEYYYKGIHLDSLNGKSTDRKQKHMALDMERADRMVQASQAFEDKALKAAVEKQARSLDGLLARNYDLQDLHALSLGKIKPSTPAEKEAATAVSRAQSALADLHRHLLDLLDENGQIAQQ